MQQAHKDAAVIESETEQRIEELRNKLDEQYRQQAAELESRLDAERDTEEKELSRKATAASETIRKIGAEEIAPLVSEIVEKIRES